MRILYDTNVLISGLVLGSRTARAAYSIALRDGNDMLVPEFVVVEFRRVVARK